MASGLNARQEKFCLEYMKDFHAANAAIRAGYSEKTAYSIGSENLRKPDIKARLNELRAEVIEKGKLDIGERIRINKAIAKATIYNYMEMGKGNAIFIKDMEDLTEEEKLAVKGFRVVGNNLVPEFFNKEKAIEYLAKVFGDFEEDNKQQVQDFTFNINVKKAED